MVVELGVRSLDVPRSVDNLAPICLAAGHNDLQLHLYVQGP